MFYAQEARSYAFLYLLPLPEAVGIDCVDECGKRGGSIADDERGRCVLECAKRVLVAMPFVGVQEFYEQSLELFYYTFGISSGNAIAADDLH